MSRGLEFGRQWEGQTVDGHFPLQRYLGGTASSAVFLTQHRNTKAAIKLLRTSQPEAQLAQWRKAAELSHPNLVRILEVGRCWLAGNELSYVVTECAEENLSEVLPRRPLSLAETEQVLRPALDVFRFLHQRGMVHARLRPSNVMSVSEQLKFSSDGIRPAGKADRPVEGSIYDAPETREGTFLPAGDVWSLGATIAEALTQKPPASTKDTLESALPQPFADIVQHCLRQNPIQRWTPREIAARLEGRVEPQTSVPAPDSFKPEQKSKRPVRILVAAVVLVAVAGIYAWVRYGAKSPQPAAISSTLASSVKIPGSAAEAPAVAAKTPGAVLSRVLPNPSVSARNTIQGKIKVRVEVSVDSDGEVTDAKFLTPGPSAYFARQAMEAAQRWKFAAPTAHGKTVPSEWILSFEFARSGTEAFPKQAEPR